MLECVSVDEAASRVVGLDGGDAEGGEDADPVGGGVGLQRGVAVDEVVLAEAHACGVARWRRGVGRRKDGED